MWRRRGRLVAVMMMTATAACHSKAKPAQVTPVRDTTAARANHPVTHLTDLTTWVDSAVTAYTDTAGRRGAHKTPK